MQLTFLAAAICKKPIALISLVEHQRLFFKSRYGLEASGIPIPEPDHKKRDEVFCSQCIRATGAEFFLVSDASADPQYCENPLVTQPPHIRFYAGAPLVSPSVSSIALSSYWNKVICCFRVTELEHCVY